MAKVKIKKNNLKQLAAQIKERVRKRSRKTLPPIIKQQVIEENILKGKSPVQGGGRFKRYSEAYRKAIRAGRYKNKNVTPVNLKLATKKGMLTTFKIDNIPDGFKLSFTDPKAEYHNFGQGNLPVRRMLPIGEEKFNRRITRALNEALVKEIKKISRRIKVRRFFGF